MFTTLLFNENLRQFNQLEQGVHDAIMIPTVALIVFAIIFISYAHSSFVKSRRREFGLFMTLGMSKRDIRKIIFAENGLVALASVIVGLLAGSVFSRLFFLVILRLLNLSDIVFSLSFKSFYITIAAFGMTFLFALVCSYIVTSRFSILLLLRESRKAQRIRINSPTLAIVSLCFLIGTLFYLYYNFGIDANKDGKLLLYCTTGMMISLFISFSQLGTFLLAIYKKNKSHYYKQLLFLSNVDYKCRQLSKVMYLLAILVMVTIFYSGIIFNVYRSSEKVAIENNPFDIAVVQTKDKNALTIEEITSTLHTKDNPITEYFPLEVMNYFDPDDFYYRKLLVKDEQIEVLLGEEFSVEKGRYVYIYTGYTGLENESDQLRGFQHQETVSNRFINDLHYLNNHFIVLNKEDFETFKYDPNVEEARIQLFNVNNWKRSHEAVLALNEQLLAFNKTTPSFDPLTYGRYMEEERFFQLASKIADYRYNKQGGALMLYLAGFVSVLFFIATIIVLMLRIFSEVEVEKDRIKKLYNIGIRKKEVKKMIAGELKLLFFIGPIVGIAIAFVYLVTFAKDIGAVLEPLTSGAIISSIYLLFQFIFYFILKQKYEKEYLEGIFLE